MQFFRPWLSFNPPLDQRPPHSDVIAMGKKSKANSAPDKATLKSRPSASSLPDPVQVTSFTAVPLRMNAVGGRPSVHYLYVRPHEASPADLQNKRGGKRHPLPPERTLFVVNLPVDATPLHLKTFFLPAGAVERVRFPRSHATEGQESRSTLAQSEDEDEGNDNDMRAALKDKTERAVGPLADLPPEAPLPSLDARVPLTGPSTDYSPILSSGSSAHVVFVETAVRDRAMELAQSGKLSHAGWPNPFAGIESQSQRKQDANGGAFADMRDARGQNKKPLTAAQAAAEAGLTAPPTGLQYLVESYRRERPPLAQVRAYADAAVLRHEFLRTNPAATEALDELRGEVKRASRKGIKAVARGPNGELLDEDGFIIVESGVPLESKKGSAARKRAADALEAENRKKQKPELEGFYKFQRTEKKRDELAALREQFKKDTDKVSKLKQTRRFKPY